MATAAGMQTATSTPAAGAGTNESRVDRDSHFNGLFQTKQNLRIEGIAEGEIQCEGTVTVVEGARVKAKVTASTVSIAGELAGEVFCRDVFQIMPTGQVEATVSARRLIVQEGGFYNGEFHMITDQAALNREVPAYERRTPERAGEAKSADVLSNEDWWSKLTGETSSAAEPGTTESESSQADSKKTR